MGIDAYSWLHKGGTVFVFLFPFSFSFFLFVLFDFLSHVNLIWMVGATERSKLSVFPAYSCSMELCLNTDGAKKLQYLSYFMHRINLLRHYEVTPVVVFDGGSIPCKAATEEERQRFGSLVTQIWL